MTPFLSTGIPLWGRLARTHAKVAELADAPDLGSGSRKALGVRLPPFAPAFAALKFSAATARQASLGLPRRSREAAKAGTIQPAMKTDFVDLSETKKSVAVEIPSEV